MLFKGKKNLQVAKLVCYVNFKVKKPIPLVTVSINKVIVIDDSSLKESHTNHREFSSAESHRVINVLQRT